MGLGAKWWRLGQGHACVLRGNGNVPTVYAKNDQLLTCHVSGLGAKIACFRADKA